MATKGAWELQDVRDKALAGSWKEYDDSGDPFKLYAWGRNPSGNLGQNNTTSYSSPVQIPGTTWKRFTGDGYASIASKLDGTLWTWGNNGSYGCLGQNNTTQYSSPRQVGSDTTWVSPIIRGDNGGCVKTDGTLWMWGRNDEGTVSQNDRTNYSSPKQVGSDTTWSSDRNHLALSDMSVAAIKTDGTLWAWGYSRIHGQNGQNERSNHSSPVQIGTATNWNFVSKSWQGHFAINTNGQLYAWGSNYWGCLGYLNAPGDSNSGSRSSPTQIPGTTWKSAVGSSTSTLGVKTDGTLWSWGANTYGQLGLNNHNGDFGVDGKSSPTQIPGTTWTDAMASWGGMVARKSDGTLWTWGQNQYGQLGTNNKIHRSSPVQVPGTAWHKCTTGNSHMMATQTA
tara:strand:- start:3024 stop:4208 length:1185 start_codon:yes stop_codon:yes gene_type:complete